MANRFSNPAQVKHLLGICEQLGITAFPCVETEGYQPPGTEPVVKVDIATEPPNGFKAYVVTQKIGTQDVNVAAMLDMLERQPNAEWKARVLLSQFVPYLTYEDTLKYIVAAPAIQKAIEAVFAEA